MHLKLVTVTHESSSYQVFHSFYEEMWSEFSVSIKVRNLFLSLAESIDQPLSMSPHAMFVEEPTWFPLAMGS
jgi:hypothetical protein